MLSNDPPISRPLSSVLLVSVRSAPGQCLGFHCWSGEWGPSEQGPTQNLGALVGAVGQGPVWGLVVPSQLEVELSSERLVGPAGDQLTALKPTDADGSHDCLLLLV